MPDVPPSTNDPAALIKLAPPRPPLPEPFWVAHRWEVALAALLLAIGTVALIVWLRRPRTIVRIPPAEQARKELEIIRACGTEAGLPVEIGRVIRRFLIKEFSLGPAEMTTAELCASLRRQARVTPEYAALAADLLQRCDAMKFAPEAGAVGADLVGEAIRLVEELEQRAPRETAN